MLWSNKYRPQTLQDVDLHPRLAKSLVTFASHPGNKPNLILHGPPGGGKKTLARALVRSMFGQAQTAVEPVTFHVQASDTKKIQIHTLRSRRHLEINLADGGGNYADAVIQKVIGDFSAIKCRDDHQRVIIISQAESIPKVSQGNLVSLMERRLETCCFVLCCQQTAALFGPLKSRCACIRVPAPSLPSVEIKLEKILLAEAGVGDFKAVITEIAQAAQGNMKRALLLAQHWNDKKQLRRPDWEQILVDVAHMLQKEKSVQALLKSRIRLNELLSGWAIPAQQILNILLSCFLASPSRATSESKDTLKHQLISWAAHYDHQICLGKKPLFQLEAFLAKVMQLLFREENSKNVAMTQDRRPLCERRI